MAHACNPRIWEMETRRPGVQEYLWSSTKYKINLGSMWCSVEPVSKQTNTTISGIHWFFLMPKAVGRYIQTISLIYDWSHATLFLMSSCHFQHSMSIFKIFQCPQNAFKHLIKPTKLANSLSNKMCLLLSYSKTFALSLECWSSTSLYGWQVHIIQEPAKSELIQVISVGSSTVLPMWVRYVTFYLSLDFGGTVLEFTICQ